MSVFLVLMTIAVLVAVNQAADRQVFILSSVAGCGALDSSRHIWVHINIVKDRCDA